MIQLQGGVCFNACWLDLVCILSVFIRRNSLRNFDEETITNWTRELGAPVLLSSRP